MDNKFEKFKKIVQSMGGELLEDNWLGNNIVHRIKTHDGKEFSRSPRKIKERGFPKRTIILKEEIYSAAQAQIIKNGGSIDDVNHDDVNKEYEFTDRFGNKFVSTIKKVANGFWNPPPYEFNILEEYCRKVLEHITNSHFHKTRKILTPAVTGRQHALELDGYCEELKLAFEYQGHASHWDMENKNYKEVSIKDKLKLEYCKNLGIDLIVINPLTQYSPTKLKSLFEDIKEQLKELRPFMLMNDDSFTYMRPPSTEHPSLKLLKNIASLNNGEFLDINWYGPYHKYNFRFASGLDFKRSAKDMLSKGWPSSVYYLQQLNDKDKEYYEGLDTKLNKKALERFRAVVESYGAILLDETWTGAKSLYNIELSSGVKIQRSAMKIRANGLPKISIKDKNSIESFETLNTELSNAGITLLEDKWLGYDTPHRMQFADGKEFSRTPKKIKEKGLPQNSDDFLKRSLLQSETAKMTPEEHLNNFRLEVEKYGVILLEKTWLGRTVPHLIAFPDGREFYRSPKKVREIGIPLDADKFFERLDIQKKARLF